MLLAERGLRVALIERDRFPRFHVGESLTGTAGDFIARHGLLDDMARLDFPSKPGVKVIGREAKNEFYVPVLRPTWQVRRAEFDALLLERACAAGAIHLRASATGVIQEQGRVVGLELAPVEGKGEGESEPEERPAPPPSLRCRMLIDASGQGAFLSRQGVAGPRRMAAFNRQIAIYSQFEHVEGEPSPPAQTTVIFYRDTHHWAWLIPVSSTLTSIGVVLPASSYKLRGGTPELALRWGLEHLNPELTRRCAEAVQTEPVRVSRNFSYEISPFVGPGWMCVGDAHCFTDPIFSFGASFALTEAEFAADCIAQALAEPEREAELSAAYAHTCAQGQARASDLVRYFWKFPAFFAFMTRGKFGDDIVRLLAGDCFTAEPLPASVEMRRTLEDSPVFKQVPEGRPREVARHIYRRFDFFQGVEAAFMMVEEGIQIIFVLSEDEVGLYDSLRNFEDQLIADFGREGLAVLSFTPDFHELIPPLDGALRIFDRRRCA